VVKYIFSLIEGRYGYACGEVAEMTVFIGHFPCFTWVGCWKRVTMAPGRGRGGLVLTGYAVHNPSSMRQVEQLHNALLLPVAAI